MVVNDIETCRRSGEDPPPHPHLTGTRVHTRTVGAPGNGCIPSALATGLDASGVSSAATKGVAQHQGACVYCTETFGDVVLEQGDNAACRTHGNPKNFWPPVAVRGSDCMSSMNVLNWRLQSSVVSDLWEI